jgi:acyl-CoA thioester hydrolase
MYDNSKYSYEARLKVPFHDLDPMQVVWHGNYFKYFEIARDGLLNKLDVNLQSFSHDTQFVFPVIRTSTKHIFPLRHNDDFTCKATLIEAKFKIVVAFEIRLIKDNILCAKGKSEQAAVKFPEMKIMFQLPEDIRKAFGIYE